MLNKQIRAAQTNEVRAHNSVRLCAQLFREQNTQSQLKCLPILQDDYQILHVDRKNRKKFKLFKKIIKKGMQGRQGRSSHSKLLVHTKRLGRLSPCLIAFCYGL